MPLNRKVIFAKIRKSFGPLKVSQVMGFDTLFNQWDKERLTDLRHLAYMLATAWHETAYTMKPIKEYGRGKGRKYGKPDPITGHTYYGRGWVQLTWAENYKKMGKILGIPLYYNPDLALDMTIATEILFEGMLTRKSFRGDFTGYALENFFNKTKDDPVGARRIINGTDRARQIAGHYYKFLAALTT